MNGQPRGSTINSANLYLWVDANMNGGNAGPATFSIYQPQAVWSQGVTWSNNGNGAWTGGSTPTVVSANSPTLGSSGSSGWVQWDVTGVVRGWMNGNVENRGLLVREDDEGHSKELGFVGGTNAYTGLRPILRVDYTPPAPPPPPVNHEPNPASTVKGIDNDSLFATVSDPDGGSVRANFQILDNGSVVWSGTSGFVASGSVARVVPPFASLGSPMRYSIRTQADDGSLQSGYTTGHFVRNPQGLMLQDAQAISLSMFANEATVWNAGPQSASDTNAAMTNSMVGHGVSNDVAQSQAAATAQIAQAHEAATEHSLSIVTNDYLAVTNTTVTPTIDSTVVSTDGSQVTVTLHADTAQTETDTRGGNGNLYKDSSGKYTPISSTLGPSDPNDHSDPNAAVWRDQYVFTFNLANETAIGSDGQSHIIETTPTLSTLLNVTPAGSTYLQQPGDPTPASVPAGVPQAKISFSSDALDARSAASTDLYNANYAWQYARAWQYKDGSVPYSGDDPMNPQYPTYPDNCTNYVSQSLAYGGMPIESGKTTTSYSLGSWDYDIGIPKPYDHTLTWSVAHWFFLYMRNHKNAAPVTKVGSMVPGDILFYDWNNDGKIDHANIVTGRTSDGILKISQKTAPRNNMPFDLWWGNYVLRDHPDAVAYGLHHYSNN